MSLNTLNKIIVPIAGLGTRMLPATKAIPKEMLPIVDKPIIQYIVEEIVLAGFQEIILVTHSSKSSVENHFDKSFELEATLEKRVKRSILKEIKAISKLNVNISSVRQGEAKGLGHAILCAKSLIGKDAFGIVLPDMLIKNEFNNSNLSLMKQEFERHGNSSILLGSARKEDIPKYGIAKIKKIKNDVALGYVENIIEKPSIRKAPSSYFAAGRYVFNNNLFKYLSKTKADKSGEIQLTEAIDLYVKKEKNTLGIALKGNLFDCGDKLGFLKANVEYAKNDPSISKEFVKYLKKG